jgi:hypothetical protein
MTIMSMPLILVLEIQYTPHQRYCQQCKYSVNLEC